MCEGGGTSSKCPTKSGGSPNVPCPLGGTNHFDRGDTSVLRANLRFLKPVLADVVLQVEARSRSSAFLPLFGRVPLLK